MSCNKRFQSKSRPAKLEQIIFKKYVDKKQSLKNLAEEYDKSISWVQKQIGAARTKKVAVAPDSHVFVADATYFERAYGFLIYRIPELKKNIYFNTISYESIFEYQKGRVYIEKLGFKIKAIVLDGRPGVRNLFSDIPTQMCHFHQKQIIRRYLTENPKLPAGIELKAIVDTLTTTTEETFTAEFMVWCDRWESFLKERSTNPLTDKWSYTHKRIRSARHSLRTNLPSSLST